MIALKKSSGTDWEFGSASSMAIGDSQKDLEPSDVQN